MLLLKEILVATAKAPLIVPPLIPVYAPVLGPLPVVCEVILVDD